MMKLSPQYSLSIAVPGANNARSRVRKQFNTLVKRTEAARQRLAGWKESMPGIVAQAEREYQPLARAYAERRRELVLLLDRMHREKIKAQRERTKLSKAISSIVRELGGGDDDPELKAILRYHDVDVLSEEEEDAVMDMVADMLGVDPEELRAKRSPETLLERLDGRLDEDEDEDEDEDDEEPQAPPRRKSAAAMAREQREAAEEDKLKQTVRDVYRKLASELHPDRETDAAEQARKTELMQRVTVAYKAGDLLALLELQLEIEQIGQSDMDSLDDQRIQQFSKILKRQLDELEDEIGFFEFEALRLSGGALYQRPTPQLLSRHLVVDIANLRCRVDLATAELQKLEDVAALKAWLKAWRPPKQSPYDDAFVL